MQFVFTPWRNFMAWRDRKVTTDFMRRTAKEVEKEYRDAIINPPKTGRMYNRRGKRHQASKPYSEYPANETGRLAASVKSDSDAHSLTVGTTMYYGKFLREGTRKMARRKMSDNALRMCVPRALARLRGWVVWKNV
jgi:hypothetical protein